MGLIKSVTRSLFAALFTATLPVISLAGDDSGHWISHPRALIVIVIGDDGGRISGPEWEYRFGPHTTNLDFELAPGRRLILRRTGDRWEGEYFHPPTRPGAHLHEPHTMLFVRDNAFITARPEPVETTGSSVRE